MGGNWQSQGARNSMLVSTRDGVLFRERAELARPTDRSAPTVHPSGPSRFRLMLEATARYSSVAVSMSPVTSPSVTYVMPYATSGALASSRDALRADSDLRAYRPCHWRDGTAGTPELIYRCHHRRAASLSVITKGRE